MTDRQPRFAISGIGGAGKTTLCAALGERLGLPVLAEGLDDALAALMALHGTGKLVAREDLKNFTGSLIDWCNRRRDLYAMHGAFVADRWEVDLLAWLLIVVRSAVTSSVDDEVAALARMVRSAARELDCVVLMPFQRPFVPQLSFDDPNAVRRYGLMRILLWETVIAGIITRYGQLPIVQVPPGPLSVEERVEAVIRGLERIPLGQRRQAKGG